jgi:Tfp pilus assembly protein PilX
MFRAPLGEGNKMMRADNRIGMGKSRGGVLISVLVFAAIIALFLAGVATLAVSHFSRASVEADRASAIHLADAAINYELRWIADDITNGNRPHQLSPASGQNGPYTGSIAGMPGTFRVYVTKLDGTGPWYAPNPVLITGQGTVNGITRSVQITGEKQSIFSEYSIYATVGMTLNGSGSIIHGNVGTNGGITVNGGSAGGHFDGSVTFNGVNPSFNGGFVQSTGNPIIWPTIPQIANQRFPGGGLNWLKTNNDNAQLKTFSTNRATDPNYDIANAVPVGATTTTYKLTKSTFNLTTDGNTNDRPGGSRYATADEGLYGEKVLIFPPGDYYFTDLTFNPNSIAMLFDTAAGNVRIWVDGTSGGDKLDNITYMTSGDPSRFRLYYNKCAELSIGGTSIWNGGIYMVTEGCQSSLKVSGNSQINGGVIGMNITLSGNSVINFPNNGGGADDDYSLWFGFRNTWKEINPNGGVVFPDGSSN